MNKWETRLQQHPAMQLAIQVTAKLESAETPAEPDDLEGFERLKKVANWIRSRIETSDGDLVSVVMLDGMNGALTNLSNTLDAYLADPQSAQLTNAQAYADAAVDAIRGWPTLESQLDVKTLQEAASSYTKATIGLVDDLRGEVEDSKRRVEELRASIPEVKAQLQAEQENLATRLSETATQLDAEKARLDSLISESQKQLLEIQETRRKENEEFLQEQKTKFDEAFNAQATSSKKADEGFRAKADSTLARLEELKGQAEKVVGAIGSTGMTGGFQIYANDQKKQADVWRYVVIGGLIVIAGIGVWLLLGASKPGFSLVHAATKTFITIPLAVIAVYAGRQSHDHRANERRARKFELEVAALDPYIALLPEDQQIQIKREMAQKIFGQPDSVAEFKGVGLAQLEPVITKAIEAAVKAAGAQITRAT